MRPVYSAIELLDSDQDGGLAESSSLLKGAMLGQPGLSMGCEQADLAEGLPEAAWSYPTLKVVWPL